MMKMLTRLFQSFQLSLVNHVSRVHITRTYSSSSCSCFVLLTTVTPVDCLWKVVPAERAFTKSYCFENLLCTTYCRCAYAIYAKLFTG